MSLTDCCPVMRAIVSKTKGEAAPCAEEDPTCRMILSIIVRKIHSYLFVIEQHNHPHVSLILQGSITGTYKCLYAI